MVRRAVGCRRHDTEEELIVLNELYDAPRLCTNFFEAGDESDREDTAWEQGEEEVRSSKDALPEGVGIVLSCRTKRGGA